MIKTLTIYQYNINIAKKQPLNHKLPFQYNIPFTSLNIHNYFKIQIDCAGIFNNLSSKTISSLLSVK